MLFSYWLFRNGRFRFSCSRNGRFLIGFFWNGRLQCTDLDCINIISMCIVGTCLLYCYVRLGLLTIGKCLAPRQQIRKSPALRQPIRKFPTLRQPIRKCPAPTVDNQ